ncbi:MAG: hypothetical protein CMB48_00355 [Euryarchaeota archaeon]|nr:hypothetical protein [Euryarchaeota archaeon]
MKSIGDEIIDLLNATWINSPNETLSKKFVIRFWSIDTQWMDFSNAEKLINELLEKEWLIENGEELTPNVKINTKEIAFGWRPNSTIHFELPKNKTENNFKVTPTKDDIDENFKNSNEDFSRAEKRLIRYISAKTGILKEEITRRAKRKKRSLSQITNSLCLLLIAKEQGMDMEEFIETT